MATPIIILFFLIFVGVLLRFALEIIGLFVVAICLFFAFGSAAHAHDLAYYDGAYGGRVTLSDEQNHCSPSEGMDAFQYTNGAGIIYGCWKKSTLTTAPGGVDVRWKNGTVIVFTEAQAEASDYLLGELRRNHPQGR